MTVMFAARTAVREMTIQQALEWAFATECARLDFDELGANEFDRPGCDIISVIQQRGALGCTVDGGGFSDPHPDAQIIAAAVEALPVSVGGRKMAGVVAECARVRRVPDWKEADNPGIVPCGWELTDRGSWTAATRKLTAVTYRYARKREMRTYTPEICPISYSGSAAALGERRRRYLAWYGALLHLLSDLSQTDALDHVRLTSGLPDLAPWKSS